MKLFYMFCILVISVNKVVTQASISVAESPEGAGQIYDFPFYNRSAWGARNYSDITPLTTPVPYVVIHDSSEPPAIEVAGCFNFTQCSQSMKNIQNLHMDANGWWDIGYNFVVGGDGAVYEGRGWNSAGAHAKYFNTISVGVCFIGGGKLTPVQLKTGNDLLASGVKLGYIKPDYRLVTHGQVSDTVPCPSKKMAKKIQTWPHYSTFPGSLKALLDVPEISEGVKEEIKNEIASVSVPV